MEPRQYHDYIFKHIVQISSSDCIFCSMQERNTGRTKLFLVFRDRERVYSRNGAKGTWNELRDQGQAKQVKQDLFETILRRNIPCFSIS